MTREEAKKIIENRFDIMDYCESSALGEALDIAIQELEQEPCEDVDEALRILDAINTSGRLDYGDYCELFDAISAIQPKQKIGRWERYIVDSGFNANWKCSICGCNVFSDYVSYRFCPSCGAKMWIK